MNNPYGAQGMNSRSLWMAVALKVLNSGSVLASHGITIKSLMVVNSTKQSVYISPKFDFGPYLRYNTCSEKYNYEVRVTGKRSEKKREKKGRKLQDKSNPAPELIACKSLTRSTWSLVYIGSWKNS